MGGSLNKPPGGGSSPTEDASFFTSSAGAAPPLNAVWNQESWAATLLDNARQFGTQLACAGGSGAIAKTAVAPLERAKVRALSVAVWVSSLGSCGEHSCLQPKEKPARSTLSPQTSPCIPLHLTSAPQILAQVQLSNPTLPPGQGYMGPWDALWRMRVEEGGWRVWFRGNGANVIRLVPEVAFKFAAHDQFRVMFSPPDGSPMGVQEKMAAGAATGARARCAMRAHWGSALRFFCLGGCGCEP